MDHSIDIKATDGSEDENVIQKSISAHRLRNAELRKTLIEKNADLSRRRPVDVHFWTWSQRDAAVIARELFQRGFLVKLIAPSPQSADEERWRIEAGALIVPDEILRDEFTEGLVRLALKQNGNYDGWGTEID